MSSVEEAVAWNAPTGPYNAAVDMIDRNACAGRGGKLAFIDPRRRLTYAELQSACARFADVLPRLGIAREHRIALIMLDTVDLPIAFWARSAPALCRSRSTLCSRSRPGDT